MTGAENEADEYRAHDPGGRAILKAADYAPPHEPIDEQYPLQLSTGRTVYHWHTRTKTARVPELQDAAPEAWVEMLPNDAGAAGLADGDLVRVESRRGSITVPLRTTGTRPGVVFVPFHYGYFDRPESPPDERGRAANELTRTEWDPVSKQPIFKVTAVRVTRVSTVEAAG
jgi:anaerobic selenocysteine-containing dehydrogenase